MTRPPLSAPLEHHEDYLRWLQLTRFRPHLHWIRDELADRTEARINSLKAEAQPEPQLTKPKPAPVQDDDLPF